MPWKEPGKGGGQDPWKQGDQPPDLDEVFRNVGSKVRSAFGGGGGGSSTGSGGGKGGIVPILLLVLVFWAAWDSVHIIDETERGVVLRFGKFTRELGPGINFTLPRPVENLIKVDTTVRSLEDRGNMLTEDENLINFTYEVQYRVSSARDFVFEVRGPETTLEQAAESALRESVGTNRLDDILLGGTREQVRLETKNVLQAMVDLYKAGIVVTEFNLVDVGVPAQVSEAYSDVVRAREDRVRFIEEARVHANSVIPEARGRAARILQEATGYRDATIALAEGEADRFRLQLEEYRQAPEVTRKRMYLQAMEDVLGGSKKVFMDANSSGNILYLPLDQMGSGSGSGNPRVTPPLMASPPAGTEGSDRNSRGARTANREGR